MSVGIGFSFQAHLLKYLWRLSKIKQHIVKLVGYAGLNDKKDDQVYFMSEKCAKKVAVQIILVGFDSMDDLRHIVNHLYEMFTVVTKPFNGTSAQPCTRMGLVMGSTLGAFLRCLSEDIEIYITTSMVSFMHYGSLLNETSGKDGKDCLPVTLGPVSLWPGPRM